MKFVILFLRRRRSRLAWEGSSRQCFVTRRFDGHEKHQIAAWCQRRGIR